MQRRDFIKGLAAVVAGVATAARGATARVGKAAVKPKAKKASPANRHLTQVHLTGWDYNPAQNKLELRATLVSCPYTHVVWREKLDGSDWCGLKLIQTAGRVTDVDFDNTKQRQIKSITTSGLKGAMPTEFPKELTDPMFRDKPTAFVKLPSPVEMYGYGGVLA